MKDVKDILFVKIDILENWRFWNKFQVCGDYEGAGREVIAQANAMLAQDTDSNRRAAMLIEESRSFRKSKQEAGQAGGRARAESLKTQAGKQVLKDPTLEEVYDFSKQKKIWDDFAREWYERNYSERNGTDINGNRILNWKGALTNDWKKNKENYSKRMGG